MNSRPWQAVASRLTGLSLDVTLLGVKQVQIMADGRVTVTCRTLQPEAAETCCTNK